MDSYYNAPKSKFSLMTQKYTLKKLVSIIMAYQEDKLLEVMEIGGGNSCFAEGFCQRLKVRGYSVIDNNELAVKLVKDKHPAVRCYCLDILNQKELQDNVQDYYDVVYSIGLIEHFRGENIKKVIEAHFGMVKEDGIVIISFPTPTLQYRITRKLMEFIHVWQFHDEKPLKWEEVRQYFEKNGNVLYRKINRKLPLTQMIVAVKRKKQ